MEVDVPVIILIQILLVCTYKKDEKLRMEHGYLLYSLHNKVDLTGWLVPDIQYKL